MLQSPKTSNSSNNVYLINLAPKKKEKLTKKIKNPRISSIKDEMERNLSKINSLDY